MICLTLRHAVQHRTAAAEEYLIIALFSRTHPSQIEGHQTLLQHGEGFTVGYKNFKTELYDNILTEG